MNKKTKNKQPVNKRIVFRDEEFYDRDEKPAAKRKKKASDNNCVLPTHQQANEKDPNQPEATVPGLVFFTFRNLYTTSNIWRFLKIKGPYVHLFTRIGNKALKNRPWVNILRRISLKIHENLLEYQSVEISKRIQRTDIPGVDLAMKLAEQMCEKVFRFEDDDGRYIDLYRNGMISSIRILFSKEKLRFSCDTETDILDRLRSICWFHRVEITDSGLREGRNAIVSFIIRLSVDFLRYNWHIVQKSSSELEIGKITGSLVLSNQILHFNLKCDDSPALLKAVSLNSLERYGWSPSLWTAIPCEEKEHLLEWVLEYGTIQLLPNSVKLFLTSWMLGVRKRMRKRLSSGDLRRTIEHVMIGSEKNELLSLNDERIEQFVVKIVDNVLNCRNFNIFNNKWREYTLELIKNSKMLSYRGNPHYKEIFHSVCQHLDRSSLNQISSLFSDTIIDIEILSHVQLQLLHFLVVFIMSTIRHVFQFKRCQKKVCFDGVLDDEVTDFQNYDNEPEDEKSFKKNCETKINTSIPASPAPAILPSLLNIHFMKPRKTLLPTPNYPPVQYFSNTNEVSFPPNTISMSSFGRQIIPKTEIECNQKKSFFNTSTESLSSEPPAKQSRIAPSNEVLLPEVTEEELSKARALRAPSVVSDLDDEEEIPKKWINAYNITLDWNKELEAELLRVKERLEKLS